MEAKVLGILLLCCLTTINGQTACSTDNGGCSDQCIDRGDGQVQCGCPCGETLDADQKQCSPSFLCDLDIYMAVDRSRAIDPVVCSFRSTSPIFQTWKMIVDAVLKQFEPISATPEINVGIQIYSRQILSTVVTAANYIGSPNVSDAIATYASYALNDCGPSGSYSRFIFFAGESSPLAQSFGFTYVPSGPSSLRSKSSTSRVAIAFSLRGDGTLTDESLISFRNDILTNFDSIIVITKTNGDDFFANEELNTRQAKLLACGSTAPNCGNVLWIDRVNDLGIPFSLPAVMARSNRNACIFRRPGAPATEANVTSCDNRMVFEIPLCVLRGLNASDLMFFNSTCSLEPYSTVVGENIVVTLAFGSCGMMQQLIFVDGVVRNRVTARVVNKMSNVPVNVFEVNLNVSCVLATFADPVRLSIKPAEQTASQNLTRSGSYSVDMKLFPEVNFITPFVPPITIKVGCNVFIEARSVLLPNLCLRFWSCWATPSQDPHDNPHHTLADYGCPKDPTFKILPPPFNNVARASFDMFQFTSGYKKPKDQKPQVYIHCKFTICQKGYNSSSCNPNCAAHRGRRAIVDESDEPSVMETIGPFMIDNSDKEKVIADNGLTLKGVQEKGNGADVKLESSHRLKIVTPVSGWSINLILYWAIWTLLSSLIIYVIWSVGSRRQQLHGQISETSFAGEFQFQAEQEKSGMNQSKQSNNIEPLPPYTA